MAKPDKSVEEEMIPLLEREALEEVPYFASTTGAEQSNAQQEPQRTSNDTVGQMYHTSLEDMLTPKKAGKKSVIKNHSRGESILEKKFGVKDIPGYFSTSPKKAIKVDGEESAQHLLGKGNGSASSISLMSYGSSGNVDEDGSELGPTVSAHSLLGNNFLDIGVNVDNNDNNLVKVNGQSGSSTQGHNKGSEHPDGPATLPLTTNALPATASNTNTITTPATPTITPPPASPAVSELGDLPVVSNPFGMLFNSGGLYNARVDEPLHGYGRGRSEPTNPFTTIGNWEPAAMSRPRIVNVERRNTTQNGNTTTALVTASAPPTPTRPKKRRTLSLAAIAGLILK